MIGNIDVDLGGGEAVLEDLLSCELKVVEMEFGEFGGECFGRESRINKSAKNHVSRGSGDEVEIGRFHSPEC